MFLAAVLVVHRARCIVHDSIAYLAPSVNLKIETHAVHQVEKALQERPSWWAPSLARAIPPPPMSTSSRNHAPARPDPCSPAEHNKKEAP